MSKVAIVWSELEDATGIIFRAYSSDGRLIANTVYDYQVLDPDSIYEAAMKQIDKPLVDR